MSHYVEDAVNCADVSCIQNPSTQSTGTLNYDGDESDIDFEMIDDDMVSSISSLERPTVYPITTRSTKVSPESESSLSDASFDRSFDTDDAVNAMSDEDQQELTFRLSEQIFPRELSASRSGNDSRLHASDMGSHLDPYPRTTDPIEQLQSSFTSTLENTPHPTNPSSPSPSVLISGRSTHQNVILHLLILNATTATVKQIRTKFSAILSRHFVGDQRFNTLPLPGVHAHGHRKGKPLTTVICPLSNFPSTPQPAYEAFFDSGVKIIEHQFTVDELLELHHNFADQDNDKSLYAKVCVIDFSDPKPVLSNINEIASYLADWQVIPLENDKTERTAIAKHNSSLDTLQRSNPECFDFINGQRVLSIPEFISMDNDHAFKRLFNTRPKATFKWNVSSTWLSYMKVVAVAFVIGFALISMTSSVFNPTTTAGISTVPDLSTIASHQSLPIIKRLHTKMIVRTVTMTKTVSASMVSPTSKAMALSGRKDVISSLGISSVQPVASARHVLVAATNAIQLWNAEANKAIGRVYDAASTAASNAAQAVNDEGNRVKKAATKAASKVFGSFPQDAMHTFDGMHNISSRSLSAYLSSRKQVITAAHEYLKRLVEWVTTASQIALQYLQTANDIIIQDWISLKQQIRTKASDIGKQTSEEAKVVKQKAKQTFAQANIFLNQGSKRIERGYRRVCNFAAKARQSKHHKQQHFIYHSMSWMQSVRTRAIHCYRHGYRDCQPRDWSASFTVHKMKVKRRR